MIGGLTIQNLTEKILDGHPYVEIYALDRELRYTYFNQSHASRMYNWSGKQLELGEYFLNAFGRPERSEELKQNLVKALNGHTLVSQEVYQASPDPDLVFEVSYSPVNGNLGRVIGVSVIMSRLPSLQEDESGGRDKLIFSVNANLKDGVYRSTLDGKILYANATFAKMFGYAHVDEILKVNTASFYSDPSQRKVLAETTLVNNFLSNRNVLFLRRDQSPFWGSLSVAKTNGADGEIYFDGTVRDISEQILASQKIDEFNKFFSRSNDLMSIADLNGVITTINPQWQQKFGFDLKTLQSLRRFENVYPEDRKSVIKALREIKKEQPSSFQITCRIVGKQRNVAWIEWDSVIDYELNKVYTIGRDITEIQIKQEREKLLSASLLKISQVSHLEEFDLQRFLKFITKEAAEVLNVERFSYWKYHDEDESISCIMLYEKETETYSSGGKIYKKDCPVYFDAITSQRTLAANDATRDPRTAEFRGNYLTKFNIQSMLDAQVIGEKGQTGVLCAEKIAATRVWSFEEKNYIGSFSEIFRAIFAVEARKRSEYEIKLREERLSVLADFSLDVISLHENFRFIYVSPAVERLLGFKQNEFLQIDPFTLIHPKELKKLKHELAVSESANVNSKLTLEYRIQNKSGKYIWVESTINTRTAEESKRITVLVTRDISDRKRNEVLLKKSDDQFKAFAKNIPGMVYIKESKGKHLFANEEMLDYFDLDIGSFLKTTAHDLISSELAAQSDRDDEIVINGQRIITREYFLEHIEKWYHEIKFPINDQVIGGFLLDITERKKAQQALEKESALQQILVDISSRYINMPLAKMDDSITFALERIGGFIEADRAIIFDLDFNQEIAVISHEWPEKKLNGRLNERLPFTGLAGLQTSLESNEIVIMEGAFDSEKARSTIGVPLFHDNECLGLICFQSEHKEDHFKEKEMSLLNVFAEILVNVRMRAHTQLTLEDSEAQYRFLVEKTSDFIVLAEPDGTFSYISNNVESLTGYTVGEYKLFGPLDNVVPEDQHIVKEVFEKITEGEREFIAEYRIFKKDKTKIWVQSRTKIIVDAKGDIQKLLVSSNDITSRKQAEQALVESEQRYRSLTETAPVGIAVHTDGILKYLNPHARKILQTGNRSSALNTNVTALVHPEYLETAQQRMKSLMTGEIDFAEPIEEKFITFKGNHVDIAISGIKMSYNGVDSICNVFTDISEIKKTEENLKRTLAEKDVLFKELHHRIKNNLQLISSLLHLKSYSQEAQDLKEFINETSTKILSISKIHDQLLRLEEVNQLDIRSYLEELANNLVDTYAEFPALYALELNVESHNLDTDIVLMLGLFVNETVSNIIKYAYPKEKGGPIVISFMQKDTRFELIVGDEGVGISEDSLSNPSASYGLQLIDIFSKQLNAKLSMSSKQGTTYKLIFSTG